MVDTYLFGMSAIMSSTPLARPSWLKTFRRRHAASVIGYLFEPVFPSDHNICSWPDREKWEVITEAELSIR
jgi:hypothetical protein